MGNWKSDWYNTNTAGKASCLSLRTFPRVCRQCGEKYLDARVVKAMEKAVLNQLKPKRILRVPVFSYTEVAKVTLGGNP